ncbi:MAG: hypothetical protein PHG85_04160 [Candidatus Altiarchaeota archaeon]|nr:hypothetical protein [Candidatus Altiarchaeota archaeon]
MTFKPAQAQTDSYGTALGELAAVKDVIIDYTGNKTGEHVWETKLGTTAGQMAMSFVTNGVGDPKTRFMIEMDVSPKAQTSLGLSGVEKLFAMTGLGGSRGAIVNRGDRTLNVSETLRANDFFRRVFENVLPKLVPVHDDRVDANMLLDGAKKLHAANQTMPDVKELPVRARKVQ